MTAVKKHILKTEAVQQKIRRMACQIAEEHLGDTHLTLIGIWERGHWLAQALENELLSITTIPLSTWDMRKHPDTQGLYISASAQLENASIVLVDDVLNTGKTLAMCVAQLMKVAPRTVEIAVLIERSHKHFPIEATYTGYRLLTTMDNYVQVDVKDRSADVFLHDKMEESA